MILLPLLVGFQPDFEMPISKKVVHGKYLDYFFLHYLAVVFSIILSMVDQKYVVKTLKLRF